MQAGCSVGAAGGSAPDGAWLYLVAYLLQTVRLLSEPVKIPKISQIRHASSGAPPSVEKDVPRDFQAP